MIQNSTVSPHLPGSVPSSRSGAAAKTALNPSSGRATAAASGVGTDSALQEEQGASPSQVPALQTQTQDDLTASASPLQGEEAAVEATQQTRKSLLANPALALQAQATLSSDSVLRLLP